MTFVERIKAAPPGRQAALAVGLLVVLCGLLFAVYFLFLRKEYEVLFRDLRTQDAATIVAQLDKTKTPYKLSDGGTTILVPADLVDATRLNVMSEDLPLKGAVGFELFNKSDMGLTEFAQRINYQRALQGELARTIMTMDGVDTARVHLTITEPTIFRADRKAPKASVTLIPRAGRQLAPETVRGIQRLIAASVPELDVANVVILDGEGQIVSGSPQVSTEDLSTPEAQQRHAIELFYAAKVREAVAALYPQGGVEVTVIADPAPDALTSGQTTTPVDPSATAARRYRLRVALALQTAVDPQRQEELRELAAGAIGESASGQPDVISVFVSNASGATDPALGRNDSPLAAAGPQPEPVAPQTSSPRDFWVSALLAALLMLFAAAAWLIYRRRAAGQSSTLTDDERRAYAQRLKDLLSDGEAHAAPPV